MLPAPQLGAAEAGGEPAGRRGRWHGLVYIAVPRTRHLVDVAARAWRRTPRRELCRDAHVSVSRPCGFLLHEVEPFLAKLRAALDARCCRPFVAVVDGAARLELPSEDGARRFRALAVNDAPALQAVVDAVDDALVAFRKGAYFAERRFHVSVAEGEALNARRSRSRSRSRDGASDDGGGGGGGDSGDDADSFASDDDDSGDDDDDRVYVDVDALVVKYGHKRAVVRLAPR